VVAAEVHIEPMGAYSEKIKSVDELQDGAIVAIPNDPTNEGRALILLQKQGLIKLKDEDELIQTPKDIVENPKNLQFKELEAAQLPRVLPDVDLAVINTNYALDGGLDPIKDSIFMEDKDSPFPNVLVVRPDNKDDPAIKELAKALNSETVRKFLKENFGDSTIPAF
jgi:D-methionine transport system substrate-binding protein